MKNLLLLSSALVVFGATSCKKDYTCVCTASASSGSSSASSTSTFTINDTKKNAKEECEGGASASTIGGSSSSSCELQ